MLLAKVLGMYESRTHVISILLGASSCHPDYIHLNSLMAPISSDNLKVS